MIKKEDKNKDFVIEIESVSSDGNGVGHIDGYTLFVPDSAPGDVLEVKLVKVKKSYGYGKIQKIITPSPYRVAPLCNNSVKCGGCSFSHIDYDYQLKIKRGFINDSLSRIGGFTDFKVDEIIGLENPYRYRNKMVFPFGKDTSGNLTYGFFHQRSHDIVPLDDCLLGDEINFNILKAVKAYMEEENVPSYDEATHKGKVRRVFIRHSYHTKEIMVVVSINSDTLPNSDVLLEKLLNVSSNIKSIFLNVNTKKNNLVMGDKNILLYGEPVISDYLCGLKYEISPNSFFQVNPVQTEKLYKTALDFAEISKTDTVLDIYCGIGTISLAAAKYAKKVVGVEIVPVAIENAKKNASENGIDNAEFYAGDANILVPKLIKDGFSPKIAILDPPRKGSDEETLLAITQANPEKIVYVSCNPATLARDMKFLKEQGYLPKKIKAVDMFPFTSHVECVVLLCRE